MKIERIKDEKISAIIPLLRLLNPALAATTLEQRLQEMVVEGYQCVGVYDNDELVGICGLWIMTKYYVGRYIEPDNMVIHPLYRSQGLGKKLMDWIDDYARSQGCVASELNCYLSNVAAQKFWKKEGYEAIAFHYQKAL